MTQDPELEQLEQLERLEQLEQRVGRALKQLPLPAAPAFFATRVMTAIEADVTAGAVDEEMRGGVTRGSFEWPLALKIAFTATGFVLVVGALLMWPLALEFARSSWHSPGVVLLRAAASAARPMIPIALVYVTAMCAVSAAAISMLKHVALGGASQS